MHELKSQLEELARVIEEGVKTVDLAVRRGELAELDAAIGAADFWDDAPRAQKVSQEASDLRKLIETWESILSDVKDLLEMLPEVDEGSEAEFGEMVKNLAERWEKLEIGTFLNGRYDHNNAILEIQAGAGGTDASDFAEMLLRMYLRYAERSGFRAEVLEKSLADEAGIKSCMVLIKGPLAYGYLKGESGVHRLVRLSPFNAKNSRETSFVKVEVLPEIEQDQQIAINADDLRIDVYRSGGSGGQSVNTTDSAVRITHLPTGIVAQCQNERSQLQNKEQAMKVLQARLIDLMEKEQAAELSELRGKRVENSFGSQIRSYVLHPYKMVKDHRTDYEESNPDRVLDGEIEGFVNAELREGKKERRN